MAIFTPTLGLLCVFLCSVLGGWKSKQNAIVHCTTTNTTSENGLLALGVAISLLVFCAQGDQFLAIPGS